MALVHTVPVSWQTLSIIFVIVIFPFLFIGRMMRESSLLLVVTLVNLSVQTRPKDHMQARKIRCQSQDLLDCQASHFSLLQST